jgi:DNA mismatch repair protein MutS2
LRAAVRFAFETGDASGVVAAAMGEAPPTHTQWTAADFDPQLFLTDLVRTCFPIRGAASNGAGSESLRAILLRPPANLADTAFRQQILRELETSPDLHDALVRVHGLLCSLRAMLDEGHRAQYDTVQHKIDILTSYAELVDTLAGRFESAQSGLQRLARLGAAIQATDGHTLLRRMLDYEGHVGTVDVRLRMGADGRVRDLSLLAVRDNRDNPLVPSLLQRIVRWLQVVILRGYRMGGREVIVRLVGDVFSAVEPDLVRCLLLLGPASFYLAGLGFRDLARAKGLEVCLPTFAQAPRLDGDTGAPRTLRKLFNPLLLLQGIVPTPCDLGPTPCDSITVLTGPNSGGKTRVLQAAALAQLLGQAGLYVPAAEAHLVWAPTMVVSLANEATAAQREGRLGAELSRIRHVFEQIQPGSLVVLDELCEGTNPSEGEALFGLVTTLLPALRPQVLVTTHFLDFAARLCRDRPVPQLEFLQVELGPDNLPTFQFVPGVATTSLARHVAQRVGVTREQLEGLIARRRHELQRRGA